MSALKNQKWETACQEYVLNGGDRSDEEEFYSFDVTVVDP